MGTSNNTKNEQYTLINLEKNCINNLNLLKAKVNEINLKIDKLIEYFNKFIKTKMYSSFKNEFDKIKIDEFSRLFNITNVFSRFQHNGCFNTYIMGKNDRFLSPYFTFNNITIEQSCFNTIKDSLFSHKKTYEEWSGIPLISDHNKYVITFEIYKVTLTKNITINFNYDKTSLDNDINRS